MTAQPPPSNHPRRVYKDDEDIRALAKEALIACAIYARDAVFAWYAVKLTTTGVNALAEYTARGSL